MVNKRNLAHETPNSYVSLFISYFMAQWPTKAFNNALVNNQHCFYNFTISSCLFHLLRRFKKVNKYVLLFLVLVRRLLKFRNTLKINHKGHILKRGEQSKDTFKYSFQNITKKKHHKQATSLKCSKVYIWFSRRNIIRWFISAILVQVIFCYV